MCHSLPAIFDPTSYNVDWDIDGLGAASDILFTRPFHSKLFNLGQVIETHRGAGILQPAVDEAVKLVQSGEWVSVLSIRFGTSCRTD